MGSTWEVILLAVNVDTSHTSMRSRTYFKHSDIKSKNKTLVFTTKILCHGNNSSGD
jgi:hypothetical protein